MPQSGKNGLINKEEADWNIKNSYPLLILQNYSKQRRL
jgi:hypothetical protein